MYFFSASTIDPEWMRAFLNDSPGIQPRTSAVACDRARASERYPTIAAATGVLIAEGTNQRLIAFKADRFNTWLVSGRMSGWGPKLGRVLRLGVSAASTANLHCVITA
jgi:hypothetical protein